MKDPRRGFSGPDRKHLFLRAEGRCERCGGVLGTDWHAHHVTQWAQGGLTAVTNGMALCAECHRKAHNP